MKKVRLRGRVFKDYSGELSRKDDKPETWLAAFADPDGNYFQLATSWES